MTSRPDFRSARGTAGFTLIEMIVVLGVLGLMLGLLLTRGGPVHSRGLSERSAINALTGGLREARSQAIATNRPVEFALDVDHKLFQIGNAAPTPLPPDFGLKLTTAIAERRSDTQGAIRFEPDGSSTGGGIELIAGRRHVKIGVDWLSGRVSIVDAK